MTPNLHALTGAYVLNALEDSELDAFEAHLDQCAECRDEVASLQATAARLARASATAPPSSLRKRVLTQAARTPQAGPGRADPDEPQRAVLPVRHQRWRRGPTLVAAAVVVGLAVVGGTAIYSERQDAAVTEAMQNKAMRIVSAPDAVSHSFDLGSTHVVMSAEMQAAVLMGEGVPMPDRDGMVYQLWMMHGDGSASPGPTFLPRDGEVMAILEGDFNGVIELAVTVEPPGGSPSPTGEMVAHMAV